MDFLTQRKLQKHIQKELSESQKSQVERKNLYPFWPSQGDEAHQKLVKLWEISSKYGWKQNWMIEQQIKIYSTINAVGTFYIGFKIRTFLGLMKRNVAKINTLIPAFAFSSIFGTTFHYMFVSVPMISAPLENHTPLMIKSSLIHLATSVIYPVIFITGTSIYYSLRFNTFPIPEDMFKSKESRVYIMERVIKTMFRKNVRSLAIFSVLNLAAIGLATYMESEQTKKLFLMELAKQKNSTL